MKPTKQKSNVIEHQILLDLQGNPLYVLVPYQQYMRDHDRREQIYDEDELIQGVLGMLDSDDSMTLIGAWRRELSLKQADMAARMGISQAAYSKLEAQKNPSKENKARIAAALGISERLFNLEYLPGAIDVLGYDDENTTENE